MKEPVISVGIVAVEELLFTLDGVFRSMGKKYSGVFRASVEHDQVFIGNESASEWIFSPIDSTAVFEIQNVVIGVDFHWERLETQRFSGELQLIVEAGKIRVINRVPVEEYLLSVISSEMSATASLELLKAHAVVSRSWLLYPILHPEHKSYTPAHRQGTGDRIIRWYERDAHQHFDVCADDHCQRYQGLSKASTPQVSKAIDETRGRVLMYNNEICDARYYKACGGITEQFDSCWADSNPDYLQPVSDTYPHHKFPDLSVEEKAREWILGSPEAFCNTNDQQVLSQVLNNYDQETTDFYRWKVRYSQAELAGLLARKSGIDFGQIVQLEPLKRGPSGRITELKITGTLRSVTVGKELEIRKWLSESHLYSSAFIVDIEHDETGIPSEFLLRGAGWGHGVGLCQIGAAVMGEKGHDYEQILTHYFSHAEIRKIY
jgi:SpoIID/LytB domain protein